MNIRRPYIKNHLWKVRKRFGVNFLFWTSKKMSKNEILNGIFFHVTEKFSRVLLKMFQSIFSVIFENIFLRFFQKNCKNGLFWKLGFGHFFGLGVLSANRVFKIDYKKSLQKSADIYLKSSEQKYTVYFIDFFFDYLNKNTLQVYRELL